MRVVGRGGDRFSVKIVAWRNWASATRKGVQWGGKIRTGYGTLSSFAIEVVVVIIRASLIKGPGCPCGVRSRSARALGRVARSASSTLVLRGELRQPTSEPSLPM